MTDRAAPADPDLDAEFELFQRQLQAAVANAAKSTEQPSSHPAPDKRPPAKPSAAEPSERPQSAPAPAPAAGRWKWDGNAWRWCTDLPTANATASSASSSRPTASTTPTVAESVSASANTSASASVSKPPTPQQSTQPQRHDTAVVKRTAAGKVWHDNTLVEFPPNDHRLFVGDLAPDATEAQLNTAFARYPSFNMSRVICDKSTGACKGYGFISFSDGRDMLRAMSEMNGKYVAGRPLKLKRSKWEKRSLKGKWHHVKALRTISKR